MKFNSESTDESLLQAVKDWRNEASWREFHDRYAGRIRAYALNSGLNCHEADEVLQETMIKLAKYLPAFEYRKTVCRFRTWLNQIVNQRIFDLIKRRQRRYAVEFSLDELRAEVAASVPPGVDPTAQAETDRALLQAALARLRNVSRPEHWQIFEAYEIQGLKADDVARLHRTSVSNVRVIRMRLLGQLRQQWKELLEQPFSKSELE